MVLKERIAFDVYTQVFIIGKRFIGNDPCAMIFGDNYFNGHGLMGRLQDALKQEGGATVFSYRVRDPEKYGVVELDQNGKAIRL